MFKIFMKMHLKITLSWVKIQKKNERKRLK